MKIILFVLLSSFTVFATDCTFSTESKYSSNTKEKVSRYDQFTAQEKELMWDLKRIIKSNTDCRYVTKGGMFHIKLSVFKYYEKVEYFGLVFKETNDRSVSFSIDYNNEFYKGFKYETNNRIMIDQSLKFILSRI